MPAFQLPQGWYRETVTRLVRDTLPPLLGPLSRGTAWRYLYACVLWAEVVNGKQYLHLNDRLSVASGRELARRGAEYLSTHMVDGQVVDPLQLIDHVGREYAAERQRQGLPPPRKRDPNVTGGAFEATLQVLIAEVCGVMPARTPRLNTLRGFELAPEGYHSRPDLALFSPQDFRLLISTKWTLRKERIGTYLHEAYFYKQRRSDLQVAFVVSEFNTNIIFWLANDPLVDRVYHVHREMLLDVHAPFRAVPDDGAVEKRRLFANTQEMRDYRRWLGLSERLFDLQNLFDDIDLLRDNGSVSEEPEEVPEGTEAADEDAGL